MAVAVLSCRVCVHRAACLFVWRWRTAVAASVTFPPRVSFGSAYYYTSLWPYGVREITALSRLPAGFVVSAECHVTVSYEVRVHGVGHVLCVYRNAVFNTSCWATVRQGATPAPFITRNLLGWLPLKVFVQLDQRLSDASRWKLLVKGCFFKMAE